MTLIFISSNLQKYIYELHPKLNGYYRTTVAEITANSYWIIELEPRNTQMHKDTCTYLYMCT